MAVTLNFWYHCLAGDDGLTTFNIKISGWETHYWLSTHGISILTLFTIHILESNIFLAPARSPLCHFLDVSTQVVGFTFYILWAEPFRPLSLPGSCPASRKQIFYHVFCIIQFSALVVELSKKSLSVSLWKWILVNLDTFLLCFLAFFYCAANFKQDPSTGIEDRAVNIIEMHIIWTFWFCYSFKRNNFEGYQYK